MIEKYVEDMELAREGLRELMKHSVNQVIEPAGPFTLVIAAENYFSILKEAQRMGVDCSEYQEKIKQFKDEMNK